MRTFERVTAVLAVVAVFGAGAARAEAVTLTEIMQLTKAGVAEEVLLALIEVDERVFAIDPDTIKVLKDAGVSPRVIVAIVKSGRMPKPQPEPVVEITPPDPPAPQVVVIERPVVHEVAVPVPVYVAVGGYPRRRHVDRTSTPYQPSLGLPPSLPSTVSTLVDQPERRRRAEPVYWGYGGKLRPDAWQPTPGK